METLEHHGSLSFTAVMRKVYNWMTIALAITGGTAYLSSTNPHFMNLILSNSFLLWGLVIAEVALVIVLSSRIHKMSINAATSIFLFYSFLSGVSLSTLFLVYTGESLATTFLITSGIFAVMSIFGYVTKKDLSKMGSLLLMALLGLIIASVVNLFLGSTMLHWITSCVGVLIFVGLIAFDTQKIKRMVLEAEGDPELSHRVAIMGALNLYLDLINLFLFLLRFLGGSRD